MVPSSPFDVVEKRLKWQSRSSIVRSNSAAHKFVCCACGGGGGIFYRVEQSISSDWRLFIWMRKKILIGF